MQTCSKTILRQILYTPNITCLQYLHHGTLRQYDNGGLSVFQRHPVYIYPKKKTQYILVVSYVLIIY